VGGGGEGCSCAGGSEEVDAGWDGEDYLRSGMRGAFWDCKILYKIPNNKDRLGTAIQAPDSKRRILVQKQFRLSLIDRQERIAFSEQFTRRASSHSFSPYISLFQPPSHLPSTPSMPSRPHAPHQLPPQSLDCPGVGSALPSKLGCASRIGLVTV